AGDVRQLPHHQRRGAGADVPGSRGCHRARAPARMLPGPRDRGDRLPAAGVPVRQPALRDNATAAGRAHLTQNKTGGSRLPLLIPLDDRTYFFASFTSTSVAVILYLMVTLAPCLSSPFTLVFASRAISHFSLSFSTTTASGRTSRTGPVTW